MKITEINKTLSKTLRVSLVLTLIQFIVNPPRSIATLSNGTPNHRTSFSIKFNQSVCPYNVTGAFVLPGETLSIAIDKPKPQQTFKIESTNGGIVQTSESSWYWKAPTKTGIHTLGIIETTTNDTITMNVFVMIPYQKASKGILNGYKIGKYPTKSMKKSVAYEPPVGFIEVTAENKNTLVAPHFKLSQFLCKQDGDFPKYLVLREKLLYKLETILERVNEVGYPCDQLFVMSGYRTPYYNRSIQNVAYSRHLWGDAADIFIDQDHDSIMDDLNGDGLEDFRDIELLGKIIDKEIDQQFNQEFLGGMGTYHSTNSHGPFLHVDARGAKARWAK